jgi:hypothetical protein
MTLADVWMGPRTFNRPSREAIEANHSMPNTPSRLSASHRPQRTLHGVQRAPTPISTERGL